MHLKRQGRSTYSRPWMLVKTPGVHSVLAPPVPIQDLSVQRGNPNVIAHGASPAPLCHQMTLQPPTLGTLLSPAPRNSIGHTALIDHSVSLQTNVSRHFIQRTGLTVPSTQSTHIQSHHNLRVNLMVIVYIPCRSGVSLTPTRTWLTPVQEIATNMVIDRMIKSILSPSTHDHLISGESWIGCESFRTCPNNSIFSSITEIQLNSTCRNF